MPSSSLVRFVTGTAAQYALLEAKDQNTLYFITDERRIYKGDTVFSGGIFHGFRLSRDRSGSNQHNLCKHDRRFCPVL